jgi:hypothetical protein
LQKLHSDLDQMKANVYKITDASEKGRWQANVDMWQIIVNHLDQMMQRMEAMLGRNPLLLLPEASGVGEIGTELGLCG